MLKGITELCMSRYIRWGEYLGVGVQVCVAVRFNSTARRRNRGAA